MAKQLSKNFKDTKFRCKCCGKLLLDPQLIPALQQLRDYVGSPIYVNCGYRCLEHNREIGSKDTSQHVLGKGADIKSKVLTPKQLARAASKIPEFNKGGIGLYNTFVHVDVRGRKARWGKKWA